MHNLLTLCLSDFNKYKVDFAFGILTQNVLFYVLYQTVYFRHGTQFIQASFHRQYFFGSNEGCPSSESTAIV